MTGTVSDFFETDNSFSFANGEDRLSVTRDPQIM